MILVKDLELLGIPILIRIGMEMHYCRKTSWRYITLLVNLYPNYKAPQRKVICRKAYPTGIPLTSKLKNLLHCNSLAYEEE